MLPISDTVRLFKLFVRRDRWDLAQPGYRPARRDGAAG